MEVLNNIPRPEYPRPQFVRKDWINLNGIWDFEFDFGRSGKERKMQEFGNFSKKILVPFCPESKLSGIEYKDFIAAVWYQREFTVPQDWLDKRVIIHFGAVDYQSEIFINGCSVGKHKGGYISFSFDITKNIKEGINKITVYAEDDTRSKNQPAGKQCPDYHSRVCHYTRTTGIWQTVWLEGVSMEYLENIKYTPDIENSCVHIEAECQGNVKNCVVHAKASFNHKVVGEGQAMVSGKLARFSIKLTEAYLWEPGNPNLYDMEVMLVKSNLVMDKVDSYFGLRSISLVDNKVLINHKPVFQRLVLDQGFYPEGVYTAPTDEDLRKDIEISMELGFNGARLHEKIFEPRFLYWADKLGYLVWGEQANWGLDISTPMGLEAFILEWTEEVKRDFSHPSIVGWCPFNETQQDQDDEVIRIVYRVTKMLDSTRPVIDTSGWVHVETDIFDVHDYDQNPETFAKRYEPLKSGDKVEVHLGKNKFEDKVNFVSEYGGIWWNPGDEDGWGYGTRPSNEKEFIERYKGLTEALLRHPKMFAFCYTQLYDVEQEVNGLYTYARIAKFDPAIIKAINSQKAAIEE